MKTVVVVGIWHLGVVNAVGLAEKGYRVFGLEFDPGKVRRLNGGRPPLFEPGLEELMARHLAAGDLAFTASPKIVKQADYLVIAYDSPVNAADEVDIAPVVTAAKRINRYLSPKTPVVITSQIPLGTSEKIEASLRQGNGAWESGVVYVPENLQLGAALSRFSRPDMLVFGANNRPALAAARALYRPFRTKKLTMDLRSAEMVKHALNAFLATSITFINEIAQLADHLGADAVAVGGALKLDRRIGRRALLRPGLGFSGGTLARDVVQLCQFARQSGHPALLFESVIKTNEATFEAVIAKLQESLGDLTGRSIGLLGLTYKPGTSTLRQSPAIKIARRLGAAKAKCWAYDPHASPQEVKAYRDIIQPLPSLEALAKRSEALVLVTEWPEFRAADYPHLASLMKEPMIIDTKNFLDPPILTKAGFTYDGFGRRLAKKERS